jgi:hypothetical protein
MFFSADFVVATVNEIIEPEADTPATASAQRIKSPAEECSVVSKSPIGIHQRISFPANGIIPRRHH